MPMLADTVTDGLASSRWNGSASTLEQTFGHQFRAGGQREALGHDDELVAAEPGHGVGLAEGAAEPGGDRPEQLVADAVPEACR